MSDSQLLDLSEPPRPVEVPRPPTPTLMDELDSMLQEKAAKSEPVTPTPPQPQSPPVNSQVPTLTDKQKLKEIQDKFAGRWTLNRSDPYDDYLRVVGVKPKSKRRLAANENLEMEIIVNGQMIHLFSNASMYSQNFCFKLNEEVTNVVQKHAQAVKIVCRYEQGCLTQHMTPIGLDNTKRQSVESRITDKGEHLMVYTCGEKICRRYFTKLPA